MSVYPDCVCIEMQLGGTAGAWTDVSEDWLQRDGVHVSCGIRGSGPLDRVASTGTMKFSLDNSANNSAGLIGYYSPGHHNCRTGFQAGIPVRLHLIYDGRTYRKFYGRISPDGIDVSPGLLGERKTTIEVVDYMDILGSHEINLLELTENVRIDQAVPLILANVDVQPLATDYNTGEDVFTTVGDTVKRRGTALGELVKLANSELGYIYITRDATHDEILVVEGRMTRNRTTAVAEIVKPTYLSGYMLMESGDYVLMEDGTSKILLDEKLAVDFADQQLDMTVKHGANLANIIKATSYPRSIDTSATVLFTLNSAMQMDAGETKSGYKVTYRDPVGGAPQVAGKNMISPAATVDYTMHADSGGTGTDLTANLSVSVTYGADGAEYTFVNSGTVAGYITKLQARGYGIYMYDPVAFVVSNATSEQTHGSRTLNLDLKYQDAPSIAEAFANIVLNHYATPRSTAESVTFGANRDESMMGAFLQMDVGGRVTISESVTAIDEDYFINGVDFDIEAGGVINYKWYIKRAAFDTYAFWYVGEVGYSELGETTFIGF